MPGLFCSGQFGPAASWHRAQLSPLPWGRQPVRAERGLPAICVNKPRCRHPQEDCAVGSPGTGQATPGGAHDEVWLLPD